MVLAALQSLVHVVHCQGLYTTTTDEKSKKKKENKHVYSRSPLNLVTFLLSHAPVALFKFSFI